MKKLLLFIALLCAMPAWAQTDIQGNITSAGGTCTLSTSCVTLFLSNSAGVAVQLSGTFTGTIQFEASADATNWVAINATPANSTTAATSATAAGAWQIGSAGMLAIRARASVLSAGGVSVVIRATTASSSRGGSGGSASAGGLTNNCGTSLNTNVAYFTDAFTLCGDAGLVYDAAPTAPTLSLVESDQAANGKWWASDISAGVSTRSLCSDTGTGCAAYETITRSGLSVTTWAGSSNAYSFLTGAATFANTVTAAGFATGTGTPTASVLIASVLSSTSVANWELTNTNTGTGAGTRIRAANGNNATTESIAMRANGTGWTTSGSDIQDGGSVLTGTSLTGGLTVGTRANATFGVYTQDALRLSITGAGVLTFDSTMVAPAATGVRYLCISTAGVITSAAVCTGT